VAMCEYCAWLEKEVPKGNLTELSAANQLELYRRLVSLMDKVGFLVQQNPFKYQAWGSLVFKVCKCTFC